MTTVRGLTGSQPVLVVAKKPQSFVELKIGAESVSFKVSQARLLAYALLSAAEDVEAAVDDTPAS